MPDELLRAVLTVAFGALAGGVTNTVAVWMLFHPHRPPRVGPWTLSFLQGAIPKNQPRLAAAIGRTVGGRLLTEEDLARRFQEPEFRRAFDERLSEFLEATLHRERGSLRSMVPAGVRPELEELLADLTIRAVARFEEWIDSEDFEVFLERRAEDLVRAAEDEPVAGILTPARETALTAVVEEWLTGAVEREGFRSAVEDYLLRTSRMLLQPERTFQEVLPPTLVAALEGATRSYLPLAIERLGSLLEDPAARDRFEEFIHDLLRRFLRDLKFHQRVVARLIVTPDTVDRVLDTIEEEGAERLSEMLRDPTVQDAMARGVDQAMTDLLRRPVTGVLGEADDPTVVRLRETVAEWVMEMARDPATREFLVEKLEQGLERAGARTWGEVFQQIPSRHLSSGLASLARSDGARDLYREGATRLREDLLDRPLGTPARWLPENASRRLESALSDPLWEWLQAQIPEVVERLDVSRRVEENVLEYPSEKMEELVRRVTDRELRMIVRLGYVLGAVIGTALLAVNWALG